MNHEKLISFLEDYGKPTEEDHDNIRKYFKVRKVYKKQILIERNMPCNQLFFVNSGLLRAYYTNQNGKEITRMVAWENRFLTNITSFKNYGDNNETIECIQDGEILSINREDFNILLSSLNLKGMYADILEEYNAMHIKRFEALNTSDAHHKIMHLKKEFPNLIRLLNDQLLASFLGISREYLVRNKDLLYSKEEW